MVVLGRWTKLRNGLRRLGACRLALAAALPSGCGAGGESPAGGAAAAAGPLPWLTDVTEQAGLRFTHHSGGERRRLPQIMGGGVALFDADGDGDLDAYLVDGGDPWSEPPATAATAPPAAVNRLFRQDAGGRFVDATDASGLGDAGYGMGVAVGDVDNDGDLDVYVTNWGTDRLYRNRGDGTFTDATAEAGIDVAGWSTSAGFLDYDHDGDLDLFVVQYLVDDPELRCTDNAGRPDYCSPAVYQPLADVLLRNEGDGTFTDVSAAAGIAASPAHGLGLVCEDLDDDGWIDVYVANDGDANHLWLNGRDGTFHEVAVLRGAAYNLHARAEAGMGVVAADLDGDELLDLFVTNLANETNTLYRSAGPAGFEDVTGTAGLAAASMAMTGFGTVALDLELDGDLDLLVANGAVQRHGMHAGTQLPPRWAPYANPNQAYLNDGRGGFALQPLAGWSDEVEIGRGLALGDVDGDGDPDVLLGNVEGPARLYRNDAPRQGRWLAVRCVDPRLRRDALGARLTAVAGGRRIVRTASSAFSYLSSSPPVAWFGLGRAARVDALEVRWPDGLHERFGPLEADQSLVLERGAGDEMD